MGVAGLQHHGLLGFDLHLALLGGKAQQMLVALGVKREDVLPVAGEEFDALLPLAVVHQQFVLAPGAQDVLGWVVGGNRAGSLGIMQGAMDHRAIQIAVHAGQGHFGAGMQGKVETVLVAGIGLHHAHRVARLAVGSITEIEGQTHPVTTLLVDMGILAPGGLHLSGEIGGYVGLGRHTLQRLAVGNAGADQQQFVAVVLTRGIARAGIAGRLVGEVLHLDDEIVTVEARVGVIVERKAVARCQPGAVAFADEGLALPVVGLLANLGDPLALFSVLVVFAVAVVATPTVDAGAVGGAAFQGVCRCTVVVVLELD